MRRKLSEVMPKFTRRTIYFAGPAIETAFLLIWTAIVSPRSQYGDNWAIYPALVVFPFALGFHILLLVKEPRKILLAVYAIGHLVPLFYFWIYCLMRISKDSL